MHTGDILLYEKVISDFTEDLIRRMHSPDNETKLGLLRSFPWWVRDTTYASVIGVLFGLLLFAIRPSATQTNQEISKALDIQVQNDVYKSSEPPLEQQEQQLQTAESEPPVIADTTERRVSVPKETRVSETRVSVPTDSTDLQRLYNRLLASGWKLVQAARYREAAVYFGRAVHLRPQIMEGYHGLALSLFEQGHEAEALSVIERVTGRKGSRAELWLLLGTAYQFLGDEQSARNAYHKYLRLSPNGPWVRDVKSLLARKQLPKLGSDLLGGEK